MTPMDNDKLAEVPMPTVLMKIEQGDDTDEYFGALEVSAWNSDYAEDLKLGASMFTTGQLHAYAEARVAAAMATAFQVQGSTVYVTVPKELLPSVVTDAYYVGGKSFTVSNDGITHHKPEVTADRAAMAEVPMLNELHKLREFCDLREGNDWRHVGGVIHRVMQSLAAAGAGAAGAVPRNVAQRAVNHASLGVPGSLSEATMMLDEAAAPEAPGTKDGDALEEAMRLIQRFGDAMVSRGIHAHADDEFAYRKSFDLTASAKDNIRAFLAPRLRPVAPEVPAEPIKGARYDAGDWSMRNWEAIVEDQRGAPAQPGTPDAADALVAEKALQARAIVARFAQPVQGEPFEIDVECLTDESGTGYGVVVRGNGMRTASRSDVWWGKRKPAEKMAAWLRQLLTALPARKRVTEAEVMDAAHQAIGFEPREFQTVNGADLREFARALLAHVGVELEGGGA